MQLIGAFFALIFHVYGAGLQIFESDNVWKIPPPKWYTVSQKWTEMPENLWQSGYHTYNLDKEIVMLIS